MRQQFAGMVEAAEQMTKSEPDPAAVLAAAVPVGIAVFAVHTVEQFEVAQWAWAAWQSEW